MNFMTVAILIASLSGTIYAAISLFKGEIRPIEAVTLLLLFLVLLGQVERNMAA